MNLRRAAARAGACFILLSLLAGCGRGKSFNAIVLSNNKGTLIIQPDETSNERASGDMIVLNSAGVVVQDERGDKFSGEDIQEGARVKIYYSGAIRESYPVQIDGCSKIVLLDAK